MQTNAHQKVFSGAIGILILSLSFTSPAFSQWTAPPTMDEPENIYIGRNAGRQTISLTAIDDNTLFFTQEITISTSTNQPGLILNLPGDFNTTNSSESITFDPANNASGVATITIVLEDRDGSTEYDLLVVINDPPAVNIPDQEISEGETFNLKLDDFVTDPDTDKSLITWSATGSNQLSVSIDNSTRTARISPPNGEWSGSENITFTANDNNELFPREGFDNAKFTVIELNDPPVLADLENADLEYTEGDKAIALTSRITVNDPDDNNLASAVVSISNNFRGSEDVLSFSETNKIRGTFNSENGRLELNGMANLNDYQRALRSITYHNTNLNNANTSTRTISFTVYDGEDNSNTLTRNIVIISTNDPPEITSSFPESATAGAEYFYQITVEDPNEDDEITITATQIPSWLSLEDNGDGTAVLSGTPSTDQLGEHEVSIRASDDKGAVDTQTFSINVIKENKLPFFISEPQVTAAETFPYSYTITVDDEDEEDELTVSAIKKPEWLTVENNADRKAILKGRPIQGDAGEYEIVLKVADQKGGSAEQAFTLTVLPLNQSIHLAIDTADLYYQFGEERMQLTNFAEITHFGGGTLSGARILIKENYVAGSDSLSLETTEDVIAFYRDGELTIEGQNSIDAYEQILASVYYHNKSAVEGDLRKVISFQVFDINLRSNSPSKEIIFEKVESLDIPNGFTPNDDGTNDQWIIQNLNGETLVEIYSRSGNKVYESSDYSMSEAWDGKDIDGNDLPPGVYFYIIDNKRYGQTYKGTVSILK